MMSLQLPRRGRSPGAGPGRPFRPVPAAMPGKQTKTKRSRGWSEAAPTILGAGRAGEGKPTAPQAAAAAGRSQPGPACASSRRGRAGAFPPPPRHTHGGGRGLAVANLARRGGVRGGARAACATKPSAQGAGDQEAEQRRAAAGRADPTGARCPTPPPPPPPSGGGRPVLPPPRPPPLPPPWLRGVGAAAERGGRAAGRVAAKPLRAGAGMNLPGGAAAGCALRRGG